MSQDIRQLSTTQATALERFETDALALPPHPEEWLSQDIDIGMGALRQFHECGLIEVVDRNHGEKRNTWRTIPGVTEWVERHIAGKTRTPCGCSTGIRTVEAGSTYSCRNDECDCQFDRETALKVVA